MYCPRCAAQNLDDIKFCRACGTNLETVALVLSGQYHPAKGNDKVRKSQKSWFEMRTEGVKKITRAIGLIASSLLIGVALGLFSDTNDWIIIWMCLVGWMACWGVISLVSGIGTLMESRFMRDQIDQPGNATPPAQLLVADEREMIPEGMVTPRISPLSSVTEHTTKHLSKSR